MEWIFKEEEEIQCSASGGLHPGTRKLLPQIAFLYSTPWIHFSALSPGDPRKFSVFPEGDGGL